jgi:hypothetical protein
MYWTDHVLWKSRETIAPTLVSPQLLWHASPLQIDSPGYSNALVPAAESGSRHFQRAFAPL